jgi:hypothetical protein
MIATLLIRASARVLPKSLRTSLGLLAEHHAAIDGEDLAGHIRICDQVEGGGGDLLRRCEATKRHRGYEVVLNPVQLPVGHSPPEGRAMTREDNAVDLW